MLRLMDRDAAVSSDNLLQVDRPVMIANWSSWREHVDFAAAACTPRETCAVGGMGITTVEAFLTASKIN